jgi:hypothetical protein
MVSFLEIRALHGGDIPLIVDWARGEGFSLAMATWRSTGKPIARGSGWLACTRS